MKYNPDIHHRRSIRLKGFDYSSEGAYFVTLCVQDRQCLFGDVVQGEMEFNNVGRLIEKWWLELTNKFPSVETDEYVIMPNHFHGILTIAGADLCVRPDSNSNPNPNPNPNPIHSTLKNPNLVDSNAGAHIGAPLPRLLQWFKTMTTNEYIRSVKQFNWPPFAGRLWQRNYYDHVLLNENELNRIRQYIRDNPSNWETDEENPNRKSDS